MVSEKIDRIVLSHPLRISSENISHNHPQQQLSQASQAQNQLCFFGIKFSTTCSKFPQTWAKQVSGIHILS